MRWFYLEEDDDTYIYGRKLFKANFDEEKQVYIEPYYRKESYSRKIRYYPSKHLFVVYTDDIITEIIFTMVCWSDDYKAYSIKDNISTSYRECYHGRIKINPVECNINFSGFIEENDLAVKV